MLYLGCDQHARQVTVCARNEAGDIVIRRQVSTRPEKMTEFLDNLREKAEKEGGYVAIVEVCGFNDWFIERLQEEGCQDVVLIQPTKRAARKTDHRDAAQLSELLWVNRARIREGQPVHGLRRVHPPSPEDRELRKLTSRRAAVQRQKAKVITLMKTVLRNHNLQHDCPVKTLCCGKGIAWLRSLELPDADRLEMDQLLGQWELLTKHLKQIDDLLEKQHARRHKDELAILRSIPGCAMFSALVLLSRIGNLARFPNPRSLANYFGLTPICQNSGDSQRSGRISKQGSSLVRFVLGMMVTHVVRRDPWMREFYRKIKRRRGAKIARVAVMRRLCTIIHHMLKNVEPYIPGGPDHLEKYRQTIEAFSTPTRQARPPRRKKMKKKPVLQT